MLTEKSKWPLLSLRIAKAKLKCSLTFLTLMRRFTLSVEFHNCARAHFLTKKDATVPESILKTLTWRKYTGKWGSSTCLYFRKGAAQDHLVE